MLTSEQLKKSLKKAELYELVDSMSFQDAVFALQSLIACAVSDEEVKFLYNYMPRHS